MKPVEQTDHTPNTGNCYAACIASILELPLEGMPNYHDDDWADRWNDWLRERGLALMIVNLPEDIELLSEAHKRYFLAGYCILAAQSPRFDCLHAVVCLDGVVVHDPSPQRDMGLGQWKSVDFILALDPRLAMVDK